MNVVPDFSRRGVADRCREEYPVQHLSAKRARHLLATVLPTKVGDYFP